MERANAVKRLSQGQSSFFAQRGAVEEDRFRPAPAPEPLRPASSHITDRERQEEGKRYEDEKRRITTSLFEKQDEQGNPLQKYISHIKVIENSAYPSDPPPAEYSTPEHNKERFIILSVKTTSGRVWMHKARQNTDGTFQIGKSWALDELQSVEIFTPALAQTPEERHYAELGGSLGFLITMAKPYYWRADKLLEKEHFILAVFRVYYKYTLGRMPEMIGFTPREREKIINTIQPSSPVTPQTRRDPQPAPLQVQDRSSQQRRRPSDQSSLSGSRTTSITSAAPQRPISPHRQQYLHPSGAPAEQPSPSPSDQWPLNNQPATNQDHYQPTQRFQQALPAEVPSALRTQPSRANFANTTQNANPDAAATSRPTSSAGRSYADSITERPSQPASTLGTSVSTTTTQRWRPEAVGNQAPNGINRFVDTIHDSREKLSQVPVDSMSFDGRQSLPERRRPPLQNSGSQLSIVNDGAKGQPMQPYSLETSRPSTRDTNQDEPASIKQPDPQMSPSTSFPVNGTPRSEPAELLANRSPVNTSGTVQNDDPESQPSPSTDSQPRYRPGLGPMMKPKLADASTTRAGTTATTRTGFKPRAGGAGERLLKSQTADEDELNAKAAAAKQASLREQDISPVASTPDDIEETPLEDKNEATEGPPGPTSIITQGLNEPATTPLPLKQSGADENAQHVPKTDRTTDTAKAKQRTNAVATTLAALDIDPYILDGREIEYDNILADFGWEQNVLQSKQIDMLQTSLRREIARLEAGSWLGHHEQKDEPIAQVGKLLEKAIAECDDMDRLLTLYSVELSTLNEDIAYIEAQSQGLQVQTANQKLLQTELQNMVNTVSIGQSQLAPLRNSSLQDPRGLMEVEESLLLLYQALSTIDPSILHGGPKIGYGTESSERISNMRALRERKDLYMNEAQHFLIRLRSYADPLFGMGIQRTKEALKRNKGSSEPLSTLDLNALDLGRSSLWQYSPLMLFAKKIDVGAWRHLMAAYQAQARTIYQDEFHDYLMQLKRVAKKTPVDEQELLFTHQEKDTSDGALGSAARKLTVKRSQTLAKTLRAASIEKRTALDKQDSRLSPYESLSRALEETIPLIFTEQNFIVDFFYASSLDSSDFEDAVRTAPPNERSGTDLLSRKPPETDRAAAKIIQDTMEGIFTGWPSDLQSHIEWAIAADPFQGIGILYALERKRQELEDSGQTFILMTLQRLTERLSSHFTHFVDTQIRAIEEMKVKITKRKGVHSVVRIFPNFSAFVESMVPAADGPEHLEIRTMIDQAYTRIIKAIFDGLRAIAKEVPSGYGGATDPEDKEALNYHILLIENMYHFYNELDERGDAVLGDWRGKAMLELAEHQEHYVSAVVRRPLGRLLDLIEHADSHTRPAASSVSTMQSSNSRSAFKKAVSSYSSSDVSKGISKLRDRIEKHFGDSDDFTISQKLVAQITGECERRYYDVLDRIQKMAAEAYENSVSIEFGREDIAQAFKGPVEKSFQVPFAK